MPSEHGSSMNGHNLHIFMHWRPLT